jgi:hypothetical protein
VSQPRVRDHPFSTVAAFPKRMRCPAPAPHRAASLPGCERGRADRPHSRRTDVPAAVAGLHLRPRRRLGHRDAGLSTLIPELVPRSQLPSAAALGGVSVNLARAIGPAIAVVLIARVGVAAVFALNTAAFLLFALVLLRAVGTAPPGSNPMARTRRRRLRYSARRSGFGRRSRGPPAAATVGATLEQPPDDGGHPGLRGPPGRAGRHSAGQSFRGAVHRTVVGRASAATSRSADRDRCRHRPTGPRLRRIGGPGESLVPGRCLAATSSRSGRLRGNEAHSLEHTTSNTVVTTLSLVTTIVLGFGSGVTPHWMWNGVPPVTPT